ALFRKLSDMYLRYYETPFSLRDDAVSRERRSLMETEGNIFREPYIETIPAFLSSGKTVTEACAELRLDGIVADFLTRGLFDDKQRLYQHQWQAFKAAMQGTHVVVTSGTGSGKTECFLLPILASLAEESRNWPAAQPTGPTDWWRRGASWVPQ